jgi:hypothetical protein
LGKGSFNTIVCKVQCDQQERAIKRIEKLLNDSYINETSFLSSNDFNVAQHVVRYFSCEYDEHYW